MCSQVVQRPITLPPRSLAVMSGPVDVWHGWVARDEAKKEQKNKNFTTKKKKETIQAIKLYNQLTTTLDFGPHVASLRHQGTPGCVKNVTGSVCGFGVVLCPAAAGQNICWMQSGRVREREGERLANGGCAQCSSESCLCHFASPI